jgi:hypothetical protein
MSPVVDWLSAVKSETWTALATGVIALFTIVLSWVSRRQAKLTRATLALARDEFFSTHRPRVIVHSFDCRSEGDGLIGAIFQYVNAGDTRARITEIGSSIFLAVEGPRPGGGPMSTEKFLDRHLEGRETSTYTVKSNVTDAEVAGVVLQGERQGRHFPFTRAFCVGYIDYTDKLGIRRKTGFCREYHSATRSWHRVENSDYEYAY